MTTLALVTPLLGASNSKTSSGGDSILFIFLIIGVAFYFFLYRPQQRKAKAQRELQKTFDVGDEVLTAGGLVGYVVDIEDDRVTLETHDGGSFVVLKQYIVRSLEEPPTADEELDGEVEDEDHSDADDEADHGFEDFEVEDPSEQADTGSSTNGANGSGGRSRRRRKGGQAVGEGDEGGESGAAAGS
jgi:preprotein translocase subunit YajC